MRHLVIENLCFLNYLMKSIAIILTILFGSTIAFSLKIKRPSGGMTSKVSPADIDSLAYFGTFICNEREIQLFFLSFF